MADKSTSSLRPPLRIQDLSGYQRALVELMRAHRFGRIENLQVRNGQPMLDGDAKVVRIAKFASGPRADAPIQIEYELKDEVRDLFAELSLLHNGTVTALEFRHGLPFLLETILDFVGPTSLLDRSQK